MKAFSLTALTFAAYLVFALLFAGMNSSRTPASRAAADEIAPALSSKKDSSPAEAAVPAITGNTSSAAEPVQISAQAAVTNLQDSSAGQAQIAQSGAAPAAVMAPTIAPLPPAPTTVPAVPTAAPAVPTAAPAVPTAVPAVPAAVSAAVAAAPAVVSDAAPAAAPAAASDTAYHSDQLNAFAQNVANGQANQVVGVFVPNVLALPVVQQPDGQTNYVAVQNNTVTQFGSPSAYGAIGLLAHNFLSGGLFFNIQQANYVVVVYGDGRQEDYRVTQIQRYQALDPANPYSHFVDPNDPNHTDLTAGALFTHIYAHPNQVVLQTCIEANGNSSWGRLFVTAEKIGG